MLAWPMRSQAFLLYSGMSWRFLGGEWSQQGDDLQPMEMPFTTIGTLEGPRRPL